MTSDRQVSETPDPNEYVWLIERHGSVPYENEARTGWTADPYGAHRYPTKQEADDQRRHRSYTAESVEHGFIPAAARPSPAEPPHDLRSRWPGNTGPMWCHTHNLPAAHAISAEPPTGDLREAGMRALRGWHMAAFDERIGHDHPVEECPDKRFADTLAALRDPAPLADEDRESLREAINRAIAFLSDVSLSDGSSGMAIENARQALRSALKAETPEPTALDVAAEAVIALVPLRTHTPEKWMANRDERSRAAIAELRRLVEAVR